MISTTYILQKHRKQRHDLTADSESANPSRESLSWEIGPAQESTPVNLIHNTITTTIHNLIKQEARHNNDDNNKENLRGTLTGHCS